MGKFEIKEYKLSKTAFLISADKKLKKAKLPKGITCIEKGAFENCLNLKKAILPAGLKHINQNAFCGCECLETIIIPSGVDHIKAGTFKNCKSLKSVEILAPRIRLEDEAFSGCENLVTLKMPNDIYGLGKNVFVGCKKLNNIEEKFKKITVSVSEHVTDFSNCELLEEVTISNNFKGTGSFSGSTVTKVTLNEGLKWISGDSFAGCENLKEITMPSTVKKIKNNAFANSGLTKITLNNGLESIWESSFSGCKNLTEVAIPSTVKEIDSNAFANSGLTKIVLPEGLEVIGDNAFADCANLKEVNIPSTVKEIGSNTFANSGLTKIVFPEGLEKIGDNAFACCKNLKEITIPSTVKHICRGAFDTPNMIINYKGTEKQWYDITANLDFAFNKGEVLVDKDPDVKVEGTYKKTIKQEETKMSTVEVREPEGKLNRVNGFDLKQTYYNAGDKVIKYLTFSYLPYNAVGDVVRCTVTQKTEARGQITGPIKPNTYDSAEWTSMWYNTTIESVKIVGIHIQFMDNTQEVIEGKDIVFMHDPQSVWHKKLEEEIKAREEEKAIAKAKAEEYERKRQAARQEKIVEIVKKLSNLSNDKVNILTASSILFEFKDEYLDKVYKNSFGLSTLKREQKIELAEDLLAILNAATPCFVAGYFLGDFVRYNCLTVLCADSKIQSKIISRIVEIWKHSIDLQYQVYKSDVAKKYKEYPKKYAEEINYLRREYKLDIPYYSLPKKPGCMSK